MADPSTDPTWLSNVGNFLTSPTGALVGAGVAGGVGLYEAGQAQKQAGNLAGQIQAAGAPAGQLGKATFGQLTGGPSVGGPMGNYISGVTGNAATMTSAAAPYATGNLTPAQKLQVDAYLRQQNEMTAASLAGTGGPGGTQGNQASTAAIAERTQNQNNAAMLTQQLVNQNFTIAQNAQASVGQTYSTLLNGALSSSGLGLAATSQAVQQQIQADQQISQYIQQLMGGIAQGLAGAGGGTVGASTPGGGVGSAVGTAIRGLTTGGGGGAVASPPTTDSGWNSGFSWGGGPGGSDYSPYVSTGAPQVPAPTADATNFDWLNTSSSDLSS